MQDFVKKIVDVYEDEKTGEVMKDRLSYWITMIHLANGETQDFIYLSDSNKDIDSCEMKRIFKDGLSCGKIIYDLGYMEGTRDSNVPEEIINILSLDDLTSLIKVYDAINTLNTAIIGALGIDRKKSPLNGISRHLIDVICNNICKNPSIARMDEFIEEVMYILCANKAGAEKRARRLLGLKFNIL